MNEENNNIFENEYDWIIDEFIDIYCEYLYEEDRDTAADNIYDKFENTGNKLSETYFKFAKKTVKGLLKYFKSENDEDAVKWIEDMIEDAEEKHKDLSFSKFEY